MLSGINRGSECNWRGAYEYTTIAAITYKMDASSTDADLLWLKTKWVIIEEKNTCNGLLYSSLCSKICYKLVVVS